MSERIDSYDAMPFRMFTQRAEREKALNTLSGILGGINLDNHVNVAELEELKHWCSVHRPLADRHPFNELFPAIDTALTDNEITAEEIKDVIWLTRQLQGSQENETLVRASLQVLHGLLHGLLADNVMQDEELRGLQSWLEDHGILKGVYPFDELVSLVTSVLADGVITTDEKDRVRAFLGDFIDTRTSSNFNRSDIAALQARFSITGICALAPEISVPLSVFCLTGTSHKAERKEIKRIIEVLGGVFTDSVNKKTNYLVVGAEGNPCWAFSCYGRKVEAAVNLRKQGHKITIIHENDFWAEIGPLAASSGIAI